MNVAWVMIKPITIADSWAIFDSTRTPFNPSDSYLYANTTATEGTSSSFAIDMLSNGFKVRTTNGNLNQSGQTFVYMCFAKNPFGGENTAPATAR